MFWLEIWDNVKDIFFGGEGKEEPKNIISS